MKRIFCGVVFLLSAVFVFFASRSVIFASTSESASGWLWGGSEQMDTNGMGVPPDIATIDGSESGLFWVSMNSISGGGPINYGVHIPFGDGSVTGYAWSDTLGWIDFEPQNHCLSSYQAVSCAPPYGNAGVFRSGNGLIGWARLVSIARASVGNNSGGWSGWISMNSSNAPSYGVTINPGTGELGGYAWSSGDTVELGWIDFSRTKITGSPRLFVCPSSVALLPEQSGTLSAFYFANYLGTDPCLCAGPSCENVSASASTSWTSSDNSIVSVASGGAITAGTPQNAAGRTATVSASYVNTAGNSVNDDSPVSVLILNGSCGLPGGVGGCLERLVLTTPNLCNIGTPSNISFSGSLWMWNCNGFGSGSQIAQCSFARCPGYLKEVKP